MIRRILVTLDASPGSLAAAEAAVEMAAVLKAELRGLFVEDTELIRLVESPLARELDLLTASSSGAETENVEGQLRVHARKAQKALVRLADRAGIPWTFQVARGSVAGEILAAAAEADLVSLGRVGWTMRRKGDLGTTIRALIARGKGRVLLLERSVALRPPIVVLYDGSEAGRDALDLAAQLADSHGGPMNVLLIGEEEEPLRSGVTERLDSGVETLWLGRPQTAALVRAVSRRPAGVLIVPVVSPHLGEEHLQALLENVSCPILAVS